MSEYSAEEVREEADGCGLLTRKRLMLRAYADLLERIKASESAVPVGYIDLDELGSDGCTSCAATVGVFVQTPVYLRPPAQVAQVEGGFVTHGHLVAWNALCGCLDRLSPGWIVGEGSAVDCAIRTIESLAEKPTAEPVAQGEVDDRKALRDLYQAYVRLLEAGMDRITSLGGDYDPVDVMEAGDPALIAARRTLAAQPRAVPAERVVEADDLSQLRAAVADWDDDCDTEVPHHVLMRLTEVGLLEADRFILTKKGQDALAAAPQPGESA